MDISVSTVILGGEESFGQHHDISEAPLLSIAQRRESGEVERECPAVSAV